MEPPRGWFGWAREVIQRLEQAPSIIRFLSRRAAVLRSGNAIGITSPALIRVEREGDDPSALLSVWGHPHLDHWLADFVQSPPSKGWEPDAGTRLPVIMAAGTAGVLMHELIGHLTESDLVAAGASPLSGLLGATITAPTLDIVDDPARPDLPGSFNHDDEGVTAQPVLLVESGRLCNFLCDRSGAAKLGCRPGRGRRADWNRPPITRQSNLVIAPGDYPPADLESEIEHGLMVTRVGGATVDPVSSRTVIRVERGCEIRHGRRRRPLKPFELTGSALEILAGIDSRVGSDATSDWRLGWCVKDGVPLATGSESPSLIVHHLEVL
jgi:TldD protein